MLQYYCGKCDSDFNVKRMLRHCPLCGNKQLKFDGDFDIPEEPKPVSNLTQKTMYFFCFTCNTHTSIKEKLSHCHNCGKKTIIDINSPPNIGVKPEYFTTYVCDECGRVEDYTDFTWDILLARREMYGSVIECTNKDCDDYMFLEYDWFEEHKVKEEMELYEFYKRAEEKKECQH